MTLITRRHFGLAVAIAATAALSAAAIIAATAGAAVGPSTGAPAPEFAAADTSGATWRLSDLADETVVLEWSNHDCPYVRKHYESGNMQALQAEATANGVIWLTIVSSAPGKQGHVDAAEADGLTESRNAAPSAVILDPSGDIGRLYDARTTPGMYVIHEGVLRYQGAIDDKPSSRPSSLEGARNYVREALDAIAAGDEIAVTDTSSYGCSVKYG